MRKVLMMAGLLAVVLLASYGSQVSASPQTCTVTCSSGSTLQCNVAGTGTCTSSNGTVTCCGQTADCNAINAWNACRSSCFDAHDTCISRCRVRIPCVDNCNAGRTVCLNHCGARPQTSFSC